MKYMWLLALSWLSSFVSLSLGSRAFNLPTNSSEALGSFNSAVENSGDTYHVPGTGITLLFARERNPKPVDKYQLGSTILRTNASLYDFIKRGHASNLPLLPKDDPFESDPNPNLYIEIETWPDKTPFLTYSAVGHVLQGLWLWMYRGERLYEVGFSVSIAIGNIGIGRVLNHDPRLSDDASGASVTAKTLKS